MDGSRSGEVVFRRGSLAVVAAVVGVAAGGFVYGIRPLDRVRPAPPVAAAPTSEVLPGRTYSELRLRAIGSGSRPTGDPTTLREGIPALGEVGARTEEQRLAAVEARRQRRAFDGAPPVVPHAVDEQSSYACASCHAKGMAVQGKVAPVMSHPAFGNCLQCHAPGWARPGEPWEKAETTFAALASAGRGERAWPGAPPAMSHSTWMRQDCTSCHGPTGLAGLRTPHPERFDCQQCHARRAAKDLPGEPLAP